MIITEEEMIARAAVRMRWRRRRLFVTVVDLLLLLLAVLIVVKTTTATATRLPRQQHQRIRNEGQLRNRGNNNVGSSTAVAFAFTNSFTAWDIVNNGEGRKIMPLFVLPQSSSSSSSSSSRRKTNSSEEEKETKWFTVRRRGRQRVGAGENNSVDNREASMKQNDDDDDDDDKGVSLSAPTAPIIRGKEPAGVSAMFSLRKTLLSSPPSWTSSSSSSYVFSTKSISDESQTRKERFSRANRNVHARKAGVGLIRSVWWRITWSTTTSSAASTTETGGGERKRQRLRKRDILFRRRRRKRRKGVDIDASIKPQITTDDHDEFSELLSLSSSHESAVIYDADTATIIKSIKEEEEEVYTTTATRRHPHRRRRHVVIVDMDQLEETRQNLSPEITSWACTNLDEQRRLSAMKILLNETFQSIRKHYSAQTTATKSTTTNTITTTTTTKTMSKINQDYDPIKAYPDVYGELRLLRFLRKDVHQDPISAARRYHNFVQWRMKYNIDANIRHAIEQRPFQPPDSLNVIQEYLPCNFDIMLEYDMSMKDDDNEYGGKRHNKDADRVKNTKMRNKNDMCPILLNVGSWDTAGITEVIRRRGRQGTRSSTLSFSSSTDASSSSSSSSLSSSGVVETDQNITLDDFLQYWVYMYESIHCHLYQQSIQNQQLMHVDEVCDLTGLNFSQLSPSFVSTVLKPWLQMTQSNYPETTKRIVMFNPPRIMNAVWNIVTPMASRGTVEKVRFLRGYNGSCLEFVREEYKDETEVKES